MPWTTTDDLKFNALWLAGEPTDGTSDYDSQVLAYMQYIYNVFVTGGTIGTRDLATSAGLYEHVVDIPQTDWMWLRQWPPFAFNTTPATLGSNSGITLNQGVLIGTMTLTHGTNLVTFSIAPFGVDDGVVIPVTGYRIKIINQAQGIPNPVFTSPRILSHVIGATSATMDIAWPQETQTVSQFVLYRTDYLLPDVTTSPANGWGTFERFCEAWKVQGGSYGYGPNVTTQPLNVGNNEQVGDQFPVNSYFQGPPSQAIRTNPTTIALNTWDTFSYRIEGSYIFRPPALLVGETPTPQEPVIPLRWRQVLSIGAAMMLMQDKVDSRVDKMASQFREIVRSMSNEYRKEQNSGSELSGRQLYRAGRRLGRRGALTTTGGLPLF